MKKINRYQSSVLIIGTILAILVLAIILFPHRNMSLATPNKIVNNKVTKKVAPKAEKVTQKNSNPPYSDSEGSQPAGSWKVKSENGTHPDLLGLSNLWIKVSIKGNHVYIMDGSEPIYTMLASYSIYHSEKSATPTGTYAVEAERGATFFNQSLQVGARTYINWYGYGAYLFHSVPTNGNNKIMKSGAKKLGETQTSHGCIRLSIPDSKWLCEKLPVGTKVIVRGK